jgi:Tol biopolymer transport system component
VGQHDLWTKRADGSGSAEVVIDRTGTVSEAFFSRDGTWLIFREIRSNTGISEIFAVRVVASSSFAWDHQDVLFSASDYRRGNGHPMYDVGPDDQRFVMLRYSDEGPWELILVQNFFEELKRLVPN